MFSKQHSEKEHVCIVEVLKILLVSLTKTFLHLIHTFKMVLLFMKYVDTKYQVI